MGMNERAWRSLLKYRFCLQDLPLEVGELSLVAVDSKERDTF